MEGGRRARRRDRASASSTCGHEKRQLPVDSFLGDPLTALAAVILFDQFPRNMFRGHADQFATDHLALAIAKAAVDARLRRRSSSAGRARLPLHAVPAQRGSRRPAPVAAAVHRARRRRAARLCAEAPRRHRALRPLPAPQCDARPRAARRRKSPPATSCPGDGLVELARFDNASRPSSRARLGRRDRSVLFDAEMNASAAADRCRSG